MEHDNPKFDPCGVAVRRHHFNQSAATHSSATPSLHYHEAPSLITTVLDHCEGDGRLDVPAMVSQREDRMGRHGGVVPRAQQEAVAAHVQLQGSATSTGRAQ